VKFALGASAVITDNLGVSGTISSVLGGITGVILFTYMGGFIRLWLIRQFPKRFGKKFTGTNRFLVKVRLNFGINGIAFLTPILLSIPVGVMLALDLNSHKRKVITPMICSCIFWSAVFFVPYFAFNIDVVGWVKGIF
jgi:hypothetical protein